MEDQGFLERLKASALAPQVASPVAEPATAVVPSHATQHPQDPRDDVLYNAFMFVFFFMVVMFLLVCFRWLCSFRLVRASQRPAISVKKAY